MAPVKGCCDFCGRPSNDILYGLLHRKSDVKCHYYCLLFSSSLDQKGDDDEGILGFLLPDIRKELQKCEKVKCFYCFKTGAASRCYSSKCKKRFHLPCAMERGSLHLFYDDFRSYCGSHRRKQKVPTDILTSKDVMCSICFEPIEDLNSNDSLWAPCCKKNGWFHRICIQKFALSAAYFFKCPLCASQNKFRDAMLKNGIYIPDQDASWELEPNAFAELLERHHCCDAAVCKCPKGRKFESESSRHWNLILCRNCASKGTHIGCIPGPRSSLFHRSTWDCNDCQAVIKGQGQSVGSEISVKVEDEEESEDEIIVVDDETESESFRGFGDNNLVTNFGIQSPNVRKILSNVIQLKSQSADLIDLVNDDEELMEIVVSDDEDPFSKKEKDKLIMQPEAPIIEATVAEVYAQSCFLNMSENHSSPKWHDEENRDFGHEVGAYTVSPIIHRYKYSSHKVINKRKFDYGNKEGNTEVPLSLCSTKKTNYTKPNKYSNYHFGLRCSNMAKKYVWQGHNKKCNKCKNLVQVIASRIYENLLIDGWCEILDAVEIIESSHQEVILSDLILRSPVKMFPFSLISSFKTIGNHPDNVCRLHWIKAAKWVCGATRCISALKTNYLGKYSTSFNNSVDFNPCQNGRLCDLRVSEAKLLFAAVKLFELV